MNRLIVFCFLILPLAAHINVNASSLFSDSTFVGLAEDRNSAREGESVTILIVESSSAKTGTDTSTEKAFNVTGQLDKNGTDVVGGVGAGLKNSGGGDTHRNGELRARITVPIVEVRGGNMLFVQGAQEVLVNGERQIIRLEGWLRKEDLSSENAVLSSRLSNASIEYVGYGVLDGSQKRGLVSKFFSAIGIL